MAIYTWSGAKVTLTEARLIPVWVVKMPSEVKWCYARPAKLRKGAKVEEIPAWHYRGTYEDGEKVCDGKWVDVSRLKADEGWNEIGAKLAELCLDGAEKYNAWNKADAPAASEFFPVISAKEAA